MSLLPIRGAEILSKNNELLFKLNNTNAYRVKTELSSKLRNSSPSWDILGWASNLPARMLKGEFINRATNKKYNILFKGIDGMGEWKEKDIGQFMKAFVLS